jgi:hypothetical protein
MATEARKELRRLKTIIDSSKRFQIVRVSQAPTAGQLQSDPFFSIGEVLKEFVS